MMPILVARDFIKTFAQMKHILPLVALSGLWFTKGKIDPNIIYTFLEFCFLGLSVMISVHHAEIIAHKIGEGLGTLVLALSVTIIEVGLIISLMGKGGEESAILARDTVFSAVMIITNGMVALCLILGGLRFKEQEFQVQGSRSLLVVLIALSGLVFVLPNHTSTGTYGAFSSLQGMVIGCICLVLYILFIIFQTKTHKSYFESVVQDNPAVESENCEHEVSNLDAWLSFFSLCTSLIAVILLAKKLSPTIEHVIVTLGAPKSSVGLLIASIVLLPETWAAISAARNNRLQTSLNLALGSGIASIALTIPVVIGYSIYQGNDLILGLDGKGLAFLMMTFGVGIITLGTGKTTLLQGAVHGGILTAYFLLSFIP
jgi:Ca2+:H+ antiporter